jgi:hypothetical protein
MMVPMNSAVVTLRKDSPFPVRPDGLWSDQARWPATWICVPNSSTPFVAAYKLEIDLTNPLDIELHVSADERYWLFWNGEMIATGPEKGDEDHWPFDSIKCHFDEGHHTLVAQVWSLGDERAFAQHSVRPGFLLATTEFPDQFNTGAADWVGKRLGGYRFRSPQVAWGTGFNVEMEGTNIDWGFELGLGTGWDAVETVNHATEVNYESEEGPCPLLVPARLPSRIYAPIPGYVVRHVELLPNGTSATRDLPILAANHDPNLSLEKVEASKTVRFLIDLDDYYCAYPRLSVTGGEDATIRVHWQESLFELGPRMEKGNRDAIEGKLFCCIWSREDGVGDTFILDGETRTYEPFWWQAGRYVEVLVTTQSEPITSLRLEFFETRYPTENLAKFESSDPRLAALIPLAVRTLQMCSNETYMDCPFYEQLQYVGDTRLQVLVNYVINTDRRLPEQALRAFDRSRRNRGVTMSRYPSRVRQIIPPFSLWYVCMVDDYARWVGDRELLSDLMPGIYAILLDFLRHVPDADSLLHPLPGWNYVDWVPNWRDGTPPTGKSAPCAPINLQFLLALQAAIRIEDYLNDDRFRGPWQVWASRIAAQIEQFRQPDGRLSDDLAGEFFSEHSQVLARLAGISTNETTRDALAPQPDGKLEQTTIYFTHYLFEAYREMGQTDGILDRLDLWHGLVADGLRTTIEMPEPTRSDCHAWGAHPLFHFLTSILGIRPGSYGFSTVEIRPQLGSLAWAEGSLPHPQGDIHVSVRDGVAKVSIPPGLSGTLHFAGKTVSLAPGESVTLS